MLVGIGHSLASLSEIAVRLKTEKELSYTKEATSDGIMRNVGGAVLTLHANTLSFEEAEALLDQLGLSLAVPSRTVTIAVPDERRNYSLWYGIVTLAAETTDNGWWRDFRLEFTGLVPVA